MAVKGMGGGGGGMENSASNKTKMTDSGESACSQEPALV